MKLDFFDDDRVFGIILTWGLLIMAMTGITAVTLWMGKQILIGIFNMDI